MAYLFFTGYLPVNNEYRDGEHLGPPAYDLGNMIESFIKSAIYGNLTFTYDIVSPCNTCPGA